MEIVSVIWNSTQLIVYPESITKLRDRRAREQETTALVDEDVFDVAHRQTARQKFHLPSALVRLGAHFEVVQDL